LDDIVRMVVVGLLVALYFLPSLIADYRKARAYTAIFVLYLILGWTAFLWVAVLVWAIVGRSRLDDEDQAAK
jgi:uncharacterized protein with PQ loop repeat